MRPDEVKAAHDRAMRILKRSEEIQEANRGITVAEADRRASKEIWKEDHPTGRATAPDPQYNLRAPLAAAEYLRSTASLEGKPVTLIVNEAAIALNEKRQREKKKMSAGGYEITKGNVDGFDDSEGDYSDATKALILALHELVDFAKATAIEAGGNKKTVKPKLFKAALQGRCERLIGIADGDTEDIAYALKYYLEDK